MKSYYRFLSEGNSEEELSLERGGEGGLSCIIGGRNDGARAVTNSIVWGKIGGIGWAEWRVSRVFSRKRTQFQAVEFHPPKI